MNCKIYKNTCCINDTEDVNDYCCDNCLIHAIIERDNLLEKERYLKKRQGTISIEEAIKAWANGNCVACYVEKHSYTYYFDGKSYVMRDGDYSMGISKDMINDGVWFIEF